MAREIFVAMFQDLDGAATARRDLERAGVPAAAIELAAGGARTDPLELWDWLYAQEPGYCRHVEDGGALLAVAGEGGDYDRIASILLRHDLKTRTEMVPDKTSQSARVRRYPLGATERAPLSS